MENFSSDPTIDSKILYIPIAKYSFHKASELNLGFKQVSSQCKTHCKLVYDLKTEGATVMDLQRGIPAQF